MTSSSLEGTESVFREMNYLRRYFCGWRINHEYVKTVDSRNELLAALLIDPESPREMARLNRQDTMLNRVLQSLLPPIIDPYELHSVLDLACGSGGWAIEVAAQYPHIQVLGVDISKRMIEYATVRAKDRHLDNCTFKWCTVFPSTQIPTIYQLGTQFDFINLRLAMAFMPYDQWIPLFQWCFQTLLPGGYFRVTEQGQYAHAHGEILAKWFRLLSKALVLRKMLESEWGSVTLVIDKWMEQIGFSLINETCYLLNFSAGRKYNRAMADDWATATQLLIPFLVSQNMGDKESLEQLREQLIQEMNAPEYLAHIYYPSFVGKKP